MSLLAQLVLTALGLSLLAVGGAVAIIPEVYRIAVESRQWLTPERCARIGALAAQ
jgi:chromate transport protein ChrA